jgi:hypothetical protein
MSEHVPSTVVNPRSSCADPSATGKSVTFYSGYYPYLLHGSTVPSQQIPILLFDSCLHILTFSSRKPFPTPSFNKTFLF